MPNAEKSISLENATDVGAGLTSKEISDRIAQGKVNGDFNTVLHSSTLST